MKIGLAQINTKVGDLRGNAEKISEAARELSDAEILVFPELALTGYPPEDLLFDPDFASSTQKMLDELRMDLPKDKVVIIGAPVISDEGLHNCAVVFHGGHVVALHRKVALPNYGVFDEKRYFRAGRHGTNLHFENATVGVVVCEDLWQSNSPARLEVQSGASVIISINASPFEAGKLRRRLRLLRAMASDLNAYMVYVNMVGAQDELVFDGASMVLSPSGGLLAMLPAFEEALTIVQVPNRPISGLQERRERKERSTFDASVPLTLTESDGGETVIEIEYDDMESLYKALILALRDYVSKQNFKGVIVPISGGIDSALVATLAVDALGADKVRLVYMPTAFNSSESLADAQAVAHNLKSSFEVIPIQPIFDEFEAVIRARTKKTSFDVADENLQARIRANVVFYLSNQTGYLVLSCSNKSEAAVGYGTIYGDMAGGFAPIKDVLKTQVYALATYRNRLSPVIPERILNRAPSAELSPGQKDQDFLPPYEVLDAFIEDFVVRRLPRAELVRKYGYEMTTRVTRMIKRAEFKRKQAPIGPKVSERGFGKDWRMPLISDFEPLLETGGH